MSKGQSDQGNNSDANIRDIDDLFQDLGPTDLNEIEPNEGDGYHPPQFRGIDFQFDTNFDALKEQPEVQGAKVQDAPTNNAPQKPTNNQKKPLPNTANVTQPVTDCAYLSDTETHKKLQCIREIRHQHQMKAIALADDTDWAIRVRQALAVSSPLIGYFNELITLHNTDTGNVSDVLKKGNAAFIPTGTLPYFMTFPLTVTCKATAKNINRWKSKVLDAIDQSQQNEQVLTYLGKLTAALQDVCRKVAITAELIRSGPLVQALPAGTQVALLRQAQATINGGSDDALNFTAPARTYLASVEQELRGLAWRDNIRKRREWREKSDRSKYGKNAQNRSNNRKRYKSNKYSNGYNQGGYKSNGQKGRRRNNDSYQQNGQKGRCPVCKGYGHTIAECPNVLKAIEKKKDGE